jgi:chromosome segregation ATPase
MQKHPMYSVKEAAAALGCDERWVREQLNQGQLKGEKQSIGMKEKWYVYSGEVERVLARKAPQSQAAQAAPQQFFGVEEDSETIDAEVESSTTRQADNPSVTDIVKIIANQFAEKLDEQKSLTFQLQRELEDKDRQLKLLPDLQKKLDEANLKQFEVDALKKQLEEVQALKDRAEAEAYKAQQIEESVLPELRKQVEAERTAKAEALAELTEKVQLLDEKYRSAERDLNEERIRKNLELEKLQAKVAVIDEYKQSAEDAARKIEELEQTALDKQKDTEEQARILDALKQAKEEKDVQVAAMEAQVQELTQKLEKANNKGFWSWFLGK